MSQTISPADEIKRLTTRLCEISANWNEMDLVSRVQEDECRQIGIALYALGGVTLMQNIYYVAKAKNRGASCIQAFWDRIGEWRW